MYTKDDVAKLVQEVGELKLDPPLEIGEALVFGLEVEAFEPVTGQVITLCRPQRQDIGETEIFVTAEALANHVATMRAHVMLSDRASGQWREPSEEARGDARKREEERVERSKQGLRPLPA